MKEYSHHGINDFIICCGHKGYVIKEYFANYFLHMSDVTFDIPSNTMEVHARHAEPWRVTLVDTGEGTMTGGRLKRVASYLDHEDAFCFTYGDGVSNVNISESVAFHRQHGRHATVTAVRPAGRFGAIESTDGKVTGFNEKPAGDGGLVSGGYFVLSPPALDYIDGDATSWEETSLTRLATDDQLMAFEHTGFWHPMDTLRDKVMLEELWSTGKAAWKSWD
jgi:glucose-1-phosphate cytidylyltransferase